ncbi:MAG: cyclodeaminase/cyclohydrolase family protein [Christensenellales bacterium]|jgi:formiminotetrahydrofolate cyclodeaminase
MRQIDWTCEAFSEKLASSAPSPGGGGAAALCGSLACALGRMVSALSESKKSCAEHKEEIAEISARLEELRLRLLELVDEDEAGFSPLSAAWGMDKSDPRRESAIEAALVTACEAPIQMMEALFEGAKLLNRLSPICSPIMISDAGAGAAICAGAIRAAALNVYVNAGLMKDREKAKELVRQAEERLFAANLADETFRFVQNRLKKD